MSNKNSQMEAILGNEKGTIAIIVALSLVALIMATALVIDVGSLYQERRFLQTVADSAALAGAQELPESPDGARQRAIEYAAEHGVTIASTDVDIGSTLASNDTITVIPVNPSAPLYFARVLGIDFVRMQTRATAIIASPEEYEGVVPWGIPRQDWKPGEEYVLKYGSGPDGQTYAGNFQALALDKPGGKEYKQNIIDGASTPLRVGDMVDTQTGNLVGPTRQGAEARVGGNMDSFLELVDLSEGGYRLAVPDSQFIMVPIIPQLVKATGKEEVEILGFVPFIITGIEDMQGDNEFGNGVAIVGTFLNQALIKRKGSLAPVQSGGIRVVSLIE